MSLFDPLLVEVLLFFQVRYVDLVLLYQVGRLLILPDHKLLICFHPFYLIVESQNFLVELLNLSLNFVVPVSLVHQIIFHVLINSIDLFIFVQEARRLSRLIHQMSKLALKDAFLSIDSL